MRKILLLYLMIGNMVCAQVGIGTTSPSSGAMLDINSTTSGLLIPRMTQVQRNAIGSPTTGLLIYQTDNTPGFYYYNGSAWTTMGSDNLGNHIATQNIQLNGEWLSGDGGDEGVFIEPAGDVGIGISDPKETLHVHQNDGTASYTQYSNNDTGAGHLTDGLVVGIAADETANITYRESSDLILGTGNLPRLTIHADGDVAIGTANANASAIVDISSVDKGFLIPRMSEAAKNGITSPTKGLLIFQNTGAEGFYYYNGSAWVTMGDNLGNHTATSNINLNGQYLSGDGDTEGLFVSNSGEVGIRTTSPNSSAALHVSTDFGGTYKGFLINGMTEAQKNAISSPATGLLIYQTNNTTGFYYYNGSAWTLLGDDNLGNHTATQNIQLNGSWLSNDGGNEGITISNTGDVGIGTATPFGEMQIHETDGTRSLLRFTNTDTGAFGSDGISIGIGDDEKMRLWNHENTDIQFAINDINFMTLAVGGGLAIGGSTPHSSARLDVTSTTQGIRIPRHGAVTSIASPAEGLIAYQTSGTKGIYHYDGTAWQIAGGDNLGNHTATENVQLGSHWLSGDGDNEGITINTVGDVGIGTSTPGSGAILDITATDGGILIPRMTLAQRNAIGSPATGLQIFQTDNTPGFYYYNGTTWTSLGIDNLGNHIATQNIQLGSNWLSNDGDNEGIAVTTNGSIGFGTTSASENLQIHESSAASNFIGFTDTSTGSNTLTDGSVIGILNDDLYAWNRENNHLRFGTNNTERMIIQNDGNIGIGTTATTELNIGDNDTGIDWISNGNYNLISDNTTIANVGSSGLFVRPQFGTIGLHELNIGDTDTGFDWTSDGNFRVLNNNVLTMAFTEDNTVGIGNATPNASAIVDIASTTQGMLTPRMTQTQRDAITTPATGLLVYQTDNTPGFYYYNGSAWTTVGGISGWALTGNAGTTAANFIGTTDSQNFAIRTNNTERLTIEAGGDIGININNPAIDLAIGDTDTGINWNNDGNIDYMANNVVAAKMTATGLFVRPQVGTVFNHDLNIGDGDTGFDWTSDGNFSVMNNNSLTMAFSSNNRVGIGTTAPTDHLHLHEATATTNFIGFTDATTGTSSATDGSVVGILNDDLFLWNRENQNVIFGANNVERMRINNAGNVGIGTTAPTNAKLQIVGSTGNYSASGRWFYGGAGIATFSAAARPHSILADGYIATETGFLAYSDERIKKDISTRSTKNDLDLINQLNVVDYNYTDYRTYGDRNNIGFIAQEIKKVMPDAVTTQKEFIPNIYTLSTTVSTDTNETTITLDKVYDVKVGDKLKVIVPDVGEKIVDIISIEGNNITTTPLSKNPEKVFVFGKQVDDFLAVEYDDVFTVSISAIQELSKQIEALKKENKVLKEENVALHQKMEQIDSLSAKIAQIQNHLSIEHTTSIEESENSQNNK